MSAHERRHLIVELLRKQPGVRVSEMADIFNVSEGTVRNDLNALVAKGRLTRFHGGAILRENDEFRNTSFSVRHQARAAEKILIARQAAELVNDGDSVLLDASSTVYYLSLAIQERQRLRVVTNGLDSARLLAKNPSNSVFLIGGILHQDGSSVTGLVSEQIIRELHTQKAFVSCSGFSLERGMTEVHFEEAQLKRKAIESTAQLIALIDSSKFGKEDLTSFANARQITRLFTDPGLSPDWAACLDQAGIAHTICESRVAASR